MAKDKKSKGVLPQKNVHLRLAYLHQATTYLERHGRTNNVSGEDSRDNVEAGSSQTRYLASHLKGVSRKSVMRLQKRIKRSFCKGCDELLIPGKTSFEATENLSKNAAKPCADVLVVKCGTCGTIKRFPIGAGLPQRKGREQKSKDGMIQPEDAQKLVPVIQ